MRDRRIIGLLVLLGCGILLGLASGGVAGLETSSAEHPDQHVEPLQQDESPTALQHGDATNTLEEGLSPADFEQIEDEIDADTVTLAATIDADGSAAWEIRYRLTLEDETDDAAFDDLASDIEANRSAYLDPFEERLRATAESAETATGREMTVTDFDISTDRREQPQATFGIVTYSFEWSGFAAVDGEEIRAGDALDQLYLDENEQLQFGWPASHRLEVSDPEPVTIEDQRVVWRGSIDFDAGQPRIVLTPADDRAGGMLWLLAGGGLLAILLGFGTYWWYRTVGDRQSSREHPTPAEATDETSPGSPTASAPSETETDENEPPMELLSNEEQLLRLLDENGGRMKQKEAADELGWSAAKTSQVVGDLRDESKVESFRLGRENVLTLPDVDLETSDED